MKKFSMFAGPQGALIKDQRILGTHKGYKARAWSEICARYGFSAYAEKTGSGSISEFLIEWL